MLRHRERMEENGIAPLTWEGKRSAAAAPDAEPTICGTPSMFESPRVHRRLFDLSVRGSTGAF